jgi:hypothetical protein
MADTRKPVDPGTPPVPVQPTVIKICSNPQCGKPRKNDLYGTICEDCAVDGYTGKPARFRMPPPKK